MIIFMRENVVWGWGCRDEGRKGDSITVCDGMK